VSFRRRDDHAKVVAPEKQGPPQHNAHVLDYCWQPQHNAHVTAYDDFRQGVRGRALYGEEVVDKFIDLSLRLIWLRPQQPKPVAEMVASTEGEEIVANVIEPKGKLITVNDWAKAKGLTLSISQATEVGMRAAKLYEAKYGMPPSQTPSWKGLRFSAYVRDMRRPWKDKGTSYLPQHLLNRVGEYPKAIIERAWRMVQAIEKAR
jgi:hypothetical protein